MTTFRWSFSQWETYNACPAKWKYKSVLKLPGLPPGPAAARGLLIHETVEKYIVGQHDARGLHTAVKPAYLPVLDEFRQCHTSKCEKRDEFLPGWHHNHYGEPPWLVTVFDAVRTENFVVHIGEWKSGKPKDTHADQRKMYALAALIGYPCLEVHVTTHYLEGTAPSEKLIAKRSAVDKLKALWNGRVEQMQGDQICAPKPGMHCNWCDYAKKRGGPCPMGS